MSVSHISSVITIAAGVGALQARPSRTAVFKAPSSNAAAIVINSGFGIDPGGVLNVSGEDAYAFTGTNGDTLQVYEELH